MVGLTLHLSASLILKIQQSKMWSKVGLLGLKDQRTEEMNHISRYGANTNFVRFYSLNEEYYCRLRLPLCMMLCMSLPWLLTSWTNHRHDHFHGPIRHLVILYTIWSFCTMPLAIVHIKSKLKIAHQYFYGLTSNLMFASLRQNDITCHQFKL